MKGDPVTLDIFFLNMYIFVNCVPFLINILTALKGSEFNFIRHNPRIPINENIPFQAHLNNILIQILKLGNKTIYMHD